MERFFCDSCKQELTKPTDGAGTGYGINGDGKKVCYSCCAEEDKQALRSLKPGQRMSMYFTGKEVTNWPGSLCIHAGSYKIKHNFARTARMVYFTFEGREFYGRNIGDMELFSFTVKKSR
jgi:hypothetical protein